MMIIISVSSAGGGGGGIGRFAVLNSTVHLPVLGLYASILLSVSLGCIIRTAVQRDKGKEM